KAMRANDDAVTGPGNERSQHRAGSVRRLIPGDLGSCLLLTGLWEESLRFFGSQPVLVIEPGLVGCLDLRAAVERADTLLDWLTAAETVVHDGPPSGRG